jgi:hypothetical protein
VIFKSRSVEAFPLNFPSSTRHILPTLTHRFFGTTFKDVSCSDVFSSTLCREDREEQCLRLTFWGSDVLQGLFRYTLCIRIPHGPEANTSYGTSAPTEMPLPSALLNVECVGVYPMSDNIDVGAIFPLRIPSSTPESEADVETWSQSPVPSPLPTPTPTALFVPLAGNAALRNGLTTSPNFSDGYRITAGQAASSRGFVSAFNLGPQGRRAAWVERRRGTTVREVVVWAKENGSREDFAGEELNRRGYVGLEGKVVFSQGSYDLRGVFFSVVRSDCVADRVQQWI